MLNLANWIRTVLGKQPVSSALAKEPAEAKAKGVINGMNLGVFSTRAQTAVMALRATKKGKDSGATIPNISHSKTNFNKKA